MDIRSSFAKTEHFAKTEQFAKTGGFAITLAEQGIHFLKEMFKINFFF